jgi:uncharacterized protein (TIGR00252 family)
LSTSTGREAEEAATDYLIERGFKIVERNWRTRWCEIDIVAAKDGVMHFVEVKYRASSKWGSGLEYITTQKFQQMRFAAEFWLVKHRWTRDVRLAAMELTGDPPRVLAFLDDI